MKTENFKKLKDDPVFLQRFLSKVRFTKHACWEWVGSASELGYGQVVIFGKKFKSHRVMFLLFSGKEIPAGMFACHKCDNPKCVRPSHIFIGSQKENMEDCSKKGRIKPRKPGVYNNARLNSNQVLKIRALYKRGMDCKAISKLFPVTHVTVHQIVNRITWKFI